MNTSQEIDPVTFIFIVISSVGFLLGFITILFFMTDAFYNFNCWFFSISLISQILCLFMYYQNSNQHSTRPINFNPYFHNAISFFTFTITSTTSILYILDTSLLHLSTLVQFLPNCNFKNIIDKFCKSKSTLNLSAMIELSVLPELFLWLLIKHKLGILATIIMYIFNILMFGYVCFDPLTNHFQNIYKFIRKQYRNSDEASKSFWGLLINIGDSLSSLSKQIYNMSVQTFMSR